MSRSLWIHRAAPVSACVTLALAATIPSHAQVAGTAARAEGRVSILEISSALVAQQLGVKLSPAQPEQLVVGASLTGSLADPARLARLGIAEATPGARVTVMRSAEQRLLVEVDELDPVARTRRVTLRLHPDGQLSVLAP